MDQGDQGQGSAAAVEMVAAAVLGRLVFRRVRSIFSAWI